MVLPLTRTWFLPITMCCRLAIGGKDRNTNKEGDNSFYYYFHNG